MKVFDVDRHITLPDSRVAVMGDLHGNVGWLRVATLGLRSLAPDISTVLQLGDWWMDTEASDEVFASAGITRVYVTLGNHEPWDMVSPLFDENPGAAVRVSEVTWLLPRPARLSIGGREVLSLGGAASVDRLWRIPGVSWFADEIVTEQHVAQAISGGAADLMLTHEGPARSPVNAVNAVLASNPMGFPDETLADSARSRERIATVWDAVHPELLMHGHMHAPGGGRTDDGRRVSSLGRDTQEGNLTFLDMATLTLESPSLRQIREAAGYS